MIAWITAHLHLLRQPPGGGLALDAGCAVALRLTIPSRVPLSIGTSFPCGQHRVGAFEQCIALQQKFLLKELKNLTNLACMFLSVFSLAVTSVPCTTCSCTDGEHDTSRNLHRFTAF